ncbi:hypothetical protein [Lysobacter capsici]|uniref:hypothetical protein n=1 Tax=Lysobacter capsici TaxID=435897 RepID=UPI0012902D88|nr:hypothetical protein [Lysobacter capsici]QWF18709.1 hypothetical protein KME82_08190 [Lysobacter capsici]
MDDEKRPVEVNNGISKYRARFLQFGQILETDDGNHPIGVSTVVYVEKDDGSIAQVPPPQVRFTDRKSD